MLRNNIKSVSLSLYGLPLPPSAVLAAAMGSPRYCSNIECDKCANPVPIRYTDGGECFACTVREFKAGLFYALNDPSNPGAKIPTSASQAHEYGVLYYFTGSACKNGPHAEKKSTLSGRCMSCREESPRKLAKVAGLKWYTPTKPCAMCGTLAERRVNNGACKGCETSTSTPSPSVAYMQACPDTVLSREDAKAMGFKVYRTGRACARGHVGFRYISTGGCLLCRG